MSSYLTPLLVALGGALGALTRYTVTLVAASFLGSSFPYGTLIVNGAGSFLIGLLACFFTQHFPSPPCLPPCLRVSGDGIPGRPYDLLFHDE